MSLTRGLAIVVASMEHAPFILDSFAESVRAFGALPAGLVPHHTASIRRALQGRLGRFVVATPIGHPETFLGWAAIDCDSILFAYVPQILREQGIASHMISHLIRTGPVRLVYWTKYADDIKRRGFPIEHDWHEFSRRERAAERSLRWNHRQQLVHA
jgi:hypothetical protein